MVALAGYGSAAQDLTLCWGKPAACICARPARPNVMRHRGAGCAEACTAPLAAGEGSSGQLGIERGLSDVEVSPKIVLGGYSFSTVCTGSQHSCALQPSGQAWCWGERAGAGWSKMQVQAPPLLCGRVAARWAAS